MENTGTVLLDDDKPQWYIALADRWIGPMTAQDVVDKIESDEITWAHFVWKPGQAEWKRICDTKSFQSVVPQAPPKLLQTEIKAASKPVIKKAQPRSQHSSQAALGAETRKWFLHYNDSQYGPFLGEEIGRLLSIGKITAKTHAWCDGMPNWSPLEKIADLTSLLGSTKKPPPIKREAKGETKSEQRRAPRKPLVAKVILAGDKVVSVGMCRDVSVGGMQVLIDQIPGGVNAHIKLNVSPVGELAISPFTAEGVIVRILEDHHGFSFRFDKLSDAARKSIESYINSDV